MKCKLVKLYTIVFLNKIDDKIVSTETLNF